MFGFQIGNVLVGHPKARNKAEIGMMAKASAVTN
jgi:hypothetical protein